MMYEFYICSVPNREWRPLLCILFQTGCKTLFLYKMYNSEYQNLMFMYMHIDSRHMARHCGTPHTKTFDKISCTSFVLIFINTVLYTVRYKVQLSNPIVQHDLGIKRIHCTTQSARRRLWVQAVDTASMHVYGVVPCKEERMNTLHATRLRSPACHSSFVAAVSAGAPSSDAMCVRGPFKLTLSPGSHAAMRHVPPIEHPVAEVGSQPRQELLLGVRQPRGACEHLEEEPKVVEPVAEGRGAGGGQAPPTFCLVCNITSCLATSISKSIIFFPLKTCSFATPKNILEGKKEGQLQEFPIIHS